MDNLTPQQMIADLGYPRYVRTSDLVWLDYDALGTWRHILRREPDTMQTYERLIALPEPVEITDDDNYVEWRRLLDSGKLTEEHLRHSLVTHYDPRYIDVMIDRTLHAEPYPAGRAAVPFGGLFVVAAPDGLTEQFAYEFRSVGTPDALPRHMKAAQLLARLDAYLLGRPLAVAHLYVRRTQQHERSAAPVDPQLARDYLAHAETILQQVGAQIAVNFQPAATQD